MTPVYIGYYFNIEPLQPASEILIAELGELGFESFVETESGIEAFIQKNDWKKDLIENVQILNSPEFKISYETKEIEQINWNEEWEKNFHPITVDGMCQVRAPFHTSEKMEYEIVIEPKMSFGTGHHETTHMMIQFILRNQMSGKKVLDMGCGTGILAILTEMKGASDIEAIDIDHWCYLNTKENVERNRCQKIKVFEGDASLLKEKSYDLIIANINRNILMNDIPIYCDSLKKEGSLFISGFYEEDLELLTSVCNKFNLSLVESINRNNWIAAHYTLK